MDSQKVCKVPSDMSGRILSRKPDNGDKSILIILFVNFVASNRRRDAITCTTCTTCVHCVVPIGCQKCEMSSIKRSELIYQFTEAEISAAINKVFCFCLRCFVYNWNFQIFFDNPVLWHFFIVFYSVKCFAGLWTTLLMSIIF